MTIRVFCIALLRASPFLQVVRCQSDSEADAAETEEGVGDDVGIVNDDAQFYPDESFASAAGVQTACVYPKNTGKCMTSIRSSTFTSISSRLFLLGDFQYKVFNNASVPPSAQATFPYTFAVSKYLQAGTFDLVGTIVYEIDQQPYQSTFFNGTVEVIEPSGFLSIETVFLVLLGLGLVVPLGLWIQARVQDFSKKPKRAHMVEVGTRSTNASMDEWLQGRSDDSMFAIQGTAYTQSLSNKSKKQK
ncbi:Translocon-associated protein subunit alpha-like protein [Drosera capensis]